MIYTITIAILPQQRTRAVTREALQHATATPPLILGIVRGVLHNLQQVRHSSLFQRKEPL